MPNYSITDPAQCVDGQSLVFHYSQEPEIVRFVPHVPKSNPTQPPLVWAMDQQHAPLYWFPRDCPRVATWPRNASERDRFRGVFASDASRIHIVEWRWFERVCTSQLFEYHFDATDFTPWDAANGHWVCSTTVEPIGVHAVGNLMTRHEQAAIELRFVDRLHSMRDRVVDENFGFSIVRFANAQTPR